MIKITILSLIVIAALILVAEPKINIYPFKVSIAKPWFAIGIALIGFGVGFIQYQGYTDGAMKGIDTAFKYLKEEIKKEKQQ
jgi:F0F1-type ATP synthase assembly protein I